MGTSRNDPSPDKGSWRFVRAIIGRPEYSVERQIQEIWRAASAERHDLLYRDFSTKSLSSASQFISKGMSIAEALNSYDSLSSEEAYPSPSQEFGRRALSRCISSPKQSSDFVAELFSEATSYYVSRDLPSYVGAPGRIKSASQAIALKDAIRQATQQAVDSVSSHEKETWPHYIERVIARLQQSSPESKKGKR